MRASAPPYEREANLRRALSFVSFLSRAERKESY